MYFTKYLSQKSNSITKYLSQKSKIIRRYLPKKINITIFHSSIIDELIENRKDLFSTYIREQVEAGLDLTTDISDDWIWSTLHDDMMKKMTINRSNTERILFGDDGVFVKDVMFPDVDGNYFIIRYCLIRN